MSTRKARIHASARRRVARSVHVDVRTGRRGFYAGDGLAGVLASSDPLIPHARPLAVIASTAQRFRIRGHWPCLGLHLRSGASSRSHAGRHVPVRADTRHTGLRDASYGDLAEALDHQASDPADHVLGIPIGTHARCGQAAGLLRGTAGALGPRPDQASAVAYATANRGAGVSTPL
jgi:hypothetical protein